jgi:hypothetical protein
MTRVNQQPIKHKMIIGRSELVAFPEFNINNIPAKVDTGADGSTIFASNIRVVKLKSGQHVLKFELLKDGHPYYDGRTHQADRFSQTRIKSSFGDIQVRYAITTTVRVAGRNVRAKFSLSDRSNSSYAVLLGRRLLKGRFMIDVEEGILIKEDGE